MPQKHRHIVMADTALHAKQGYGFDEFGFWNVNLDTGEMVLCDISRRILGIPQSSTPKLTDVLSGFIPNEKYAFLKKIRSATPANLVFQHQCTLSNQPQSAVLMKGHVDFASSDGKLRSASGVIAGMTRPQHAKENQTDLLAMVSHELKSPLTTIKLYIQLAEKTGGSATKRDGSYLASALREVDHMHLLMENFLDLSAVETGNVSVYPRRFDLNTVIQEEVDHLTRVERSHRFEYSASVRLMVFADEIKIRHVIANLISNAIKYSPKGSAITLSSTRKGNKTVVSVSDQGPGISLEDQLRLFGKFCRVGGQAQNSKAGHGMGLYLVKQIMLAHGGDVWVESTPGQGAVFNFCLPRMASNRLPAR